MQIAENLRRGDDTTRMDLAPFLGLLETLRAQDEVASLSGAHPPRPAS